MFATALTVQAAPPALAQGQTLTVWHAYRGEERAAFDKAIKLFNEQNQGSVQAKALPVPFDAYADKISAAVPRGTGPDLFIFAQDRLGGWIEAGNIIEPIDFYIEDDVRERFLPNMMEAMTYRDQVFGLPFKYAAIAMIYNKAKVQNPPKTTGELVTWAKANTDASTGRYGWSYTYADFYYHAALMNGFGGGLFKTDGAGTLAEPTVNSPANVKSFEQLMSWFKQDGVLPAEPSTALVTSLFNEGKSDIVFSGPWFLGEVAKGIEIGVAPLPTLDEAGGEPMRPWMTVEGLFVSAQSKNKDAAYELARFLTTDEVAKIMALEGRQQPTNKNVYSDPAIAKDPILSGFRAQAETAVPMPNLAVMSLMWSPMTTAMNKIVKGTASPKQALDEAQQMLAADIANLRKSR